MIKNTIITILAIAIVIFGGIKLFGNEGSIAGGTSNFDAITLTDGLTVAGSTRFASSTTSGGLNSVVNSTTTVTLTQADFTGYSTVSVLASTTGASTITLPASSTLTTLVANAGDTATFSIVNATSAAAHVLTFAGGTGTTLQNASTSAILVAGKTGFLRLVRLANTNVIAQFIPFGY